MFQGIAPRYDLMNRLMTAGQDRAWRRFVVWKATLPAAGLALDLATGTGDIAFELLRNQPAAHAIGADFAPAMMLAGRKRPGGERVRWVMADALNLPFPAQTFDAVTHGFLLRNVIDIPRALREQWRVLRPGGKLVALDTSPPPRSLLSPAIRFHLGVVIPMLGRLLTGSRTAYSYLPRSTVGFKMPDELALLFKDAGFAEVGYRRFMLGTIAVLWAVKPLM